MTFEPKTVELDILVSSFAMFHASTAPSMTPLNEALLQLHGHHVVHFKHKAGSSITRCPIETLAQFEGVEVVHLKV